MKCHKCGCMDLEYIGVANIPQGVFHSYKCEKCGEFTLVVEEAYERAS